MTVFRSLVPAVLILALSGPGVTLGQASGDEIARLQAVLRDPNATEQQKHLAVLEMRHAFTIQALEKKFADLEKKFADLEAKTEARGVFGSVDSSIVVNTVYTAPADGFVWVYWGGTGSVGHVNLWVEKRVGARSHADHYGSCFAVVKKGETYRIQVNAGHKPTDVYGYFLPIR